MSGAGGSFVNRPRGGFAQMPGPWAPSFNLPEEMRRTPMKLVRSHLYPWAKDKTQAGIEEAQAGGFQPPFVLPRTASHPRKNPQGAATAIGQARMRLQALRDQALGRLSLPSKPIPSLPVQPSTRAPGALNVPNIPYPMNENPAVYDAARAASSDPVGYFDPRAERITFLDELSKRLSLDAFTNATRSR